MLSRLKDHRERRKRRFEEARAEGRAIGRAQVIAEAKAKAEAEIYQEIAEWNKRRLDAQARNEPFTEPLPEPPDTTH